MKEKYFDEIRAYLKLIGKANKELSTAYKLDEKARNLHWTLSNVTGDERHNQHLESEKLFKESREKSELYTLVKSASETALMISAYNALVEEFKSNVEFWCKSPVTYKRFDSAIDNFFEPFRKVYERGTSNFKIYCEYGSFKLVNYQLSHNYNEIYLCFAHGDTNRLTAELIEKMETKNNIEPKNIVSSCKKALKDKTKIEEIYKKHMTQ